MNFPDPRPEIKNLPSIHHGAFDFAELERIGLGPDEVLDFGVNSNPFGTPPAVIEAIRQVPLERYPDREALALRTALGKHLKVRLDQIVVGNGTSELLSMVAQAYVRPDDPALILAPTYGEYARAVTMMGGRVETLWAAESNNFQHSPNVIGERLRVELPRLVFVCNPNNPTGNVISLEVIAGWAKENPETLFVVDEAYLKFVPGLESTLSIGAPNLLVLASMTKDYAIAGLRLGYAVGHPDIVDPLARVRPPWNVNALALAAGLAVLDEHDYLKDSLCKLRRARDELFSGLKSLDYRLIPSMTHYCLIRVGDGADFRSRLLSKRIQVRDCASFRLPKYLRIATRLPAENHRLLAAIKELRS